jgi:hypothetical protein
VENAEGSKAGDPAGALATLDLTVKHWGGSEPGKRAGELAKAWRSDKEFQGELSIGTTWQEFDTWVKKLKPAKDGDDNATNLAWYRANRRSLGKMQSIGEDLREDHPDHAITAEVQAILADLALPTSDQEDQWFTVMQRALGYERQLRKVREGDSQHKNERWRKANRGVIESIARDAGRLAREAPEHAYTKTLGELAERYGIPLPK